MASKQHGLHTMNATRPKSKLSKRNNKAKARGRKAKLLEALEEAIKASKDMGLPKATDIPKDKTPALKTTKTKTPTPPSETKPKKKTTDKKPQAKKEAKA